jgi:hypothetical protein
LKKIKKSNSPILIINSPNPQQLFRDIKEIKMILLKIKLQILLEDKLLEILEELQHLGDKVCERYQKK